MGKHTRIHSDSVKLVATCRVGNRSTPKQNLPDILQYRSEIWISLLLLEISDGSCSPSAPSPLALPFPIASHTGDATQRVTPKEQGLEGLLSDVMLRRTGKCDEQWLAKTKRRHIKRTKHNNKRRKTRPAYHTTAHIPISTRHNKENVDTYKTSTQEPFREKKKKNGIKRKTTK